MPKLLLKSSLIKKIETEEEMMEALGDLRKIGKTSSEREYGIFSFLSLIASWRKTVVPERNLLEECHVGTGRCPGSLERALKNFG